MSATYNFPWPFDTYQETVKQRFINNTHIQPFSPRPILGNYTPYTDPWGRSISDDLGSQVFLYGWFPVTTLRLGTEVDDDLTPISPPPVIVGSSWEPMISPAATPSSGANSYWPSASALLTPGWNDYSLGDPSNGVYKITIKNTGTDPSGTGDVAEFFNVGWQKYVGANQEFYLPMVIDSAATALVFQIYVDGPSGMSLPANTLKFTFRDGTGASPWYQPNDTLDRSMTINVAIPFGQWTEIALTPPATNNASAYTDKNGTVHAGITYDRCVMSVINSIDGAFFSSESLPIYLTAGAQAGDYVPPDPPTPDPVAPESCLAAGARIDTDTPSLNYGIVLAVDHDRQDVAYFGNGWPITSAFQLAGPCASDRQTGSNVYAGDQFGRLSRFGLEGVYNVGAATDDFRREVMSGGVNSVIVDVAETHELPVHRMALKNVIATLESAATGARQLGLVLINDESQIIVTSNWTTPPVAGDVLWLGLQDSVVHYPELHLNRGSAVVAGELDFIPTAGQTPSYQMSVLIPSGRETWSSVLGTYATIGIEELEYEDGRVIFDPIMSKSIRVLLSWKAVPYGLSKINNAKIYLRPFPGEKGKA